MARSTSKRTSIPATLFAPRVADQQRIADQRSIRFASRCYKTASIDLKIRSRSLSGNGVGNSVGCRRDATFAGFIDAGGGNGYRPTDHSRTLEASGGELARERCERTWLPKVTPRMVFKAETFFTVARLSLTEAAREPFGGPPPDFLSHSHVEGSCAFSRNAVASRSVFLRRAKLARCHRRASGVSKAVLRGASESSSIVRS